MFWGSVFHGCWLVELVVAHTTADARKTTLSWALSEKRSAIK
jgi:hypothetical protein